MNLLTDGKSELLKEIRKRKSALDALRQEYYRLESEYKDLKKRYELIDREWAMRTKIRVINSVKKSTVTSHLTQEQINNLLNELADLIKK
jgi:archaellum component FlaC